MKQMPLIPIFILNWNGTDDTIEAINSALAQDYPNILIVVMDNFSDAKEKQRLEIVLKVLPKIRYVSFNENYGFGKAHNLALDILRSEGYNFSFLALLNNDACAEKNWLTQLYLHAQSTQSDMISSKMIQYFDHSKMDNAGHFMLTTGEILPIGHGEDPKLYNRSFSNLGPCAGACLYRTSMIDKIGFFDPYFDTGYEDAELGIRGVVAGYSATFAANAVVYHKMGQSLNKIRNIEYVIKTQKYIFYSYFKLMPIGLLIWFIPSLIFKFVVMFVINWVYGRKDYNLMLQESWKDVWINRKQLFLINRRFNILRKLNYLQLRCRLTWFLKTDIKRFARIFLFNKS